MKKLLLVLCAALSIARLQAYNIKIDNETDHSRATDVQGYITFANAERISFELPADEEMEFEVPDDAGKTIMEVTGTSGAGAEQTARYVVPSGKLGKKIELEVHVKNGQLLIKPGHRWPF